MEPKNIEDHNLVFLRNTQLRGCPIDGCSKGTSKMSYADLNAHLKNECHEVTLECQCHLTFKRSQRADHVCKVETVVKCQTC